MTPRVRPGALAVMLACVGSLAAGFLGEAIGIMPVLAMQGVGYVVAGLLMLGTLDRAAGHAPAAVSLDLPRTS